VCLENIKLVEASTASHPVHSLIGALNSLIIHRIKKFF